MADLPAVLMVDNNVGDIRLARFALEESGLKVRLVVASDGKQGQAVLAAMATGTPPVYRVVLLDLNMPRMDGRQLLSWIRAQPRLAALPVIILTSSHIDTDRDASLLGGANAYWVKPSDFSEYVAMMAQLADFLG